MVKMTRDEMIEILRKQWVSVYFTKVNGEERFMTATLCESMIPEDKRPKVGKEYNDSVIRAFDTELQEWRSFRVENVTKFLP